MEVKFFIKSTFGRDLAYPANDTARTFCRIAGSRTLSKEVMGEIEKLGIDLVLDVDPVAAKKYPFGGRK